MIIIESQKVCDFFDTDYAITIFIFIFVRNRNDLQTVNHERIHVRQQMEMLFVLQWIWTGIEYLRLGYKNNPFEKEAFANENDLNYLKNRKFWAWIKYYKQL